MAPPILRPTDDSDTHMHEHRDQTEHYLLCRVATKLANAVHG